MTGRVSVCSVTKKRRGRGFRYHENLTAGLCALTGGRANEVIAMNSLTANIHMMLASFYRPAGAHARS